MACCVDSNGDFIPLGANFIKCLTKDYAEYVIHIIAPGSISWTITKRYSQFHALHEKLAKHHGLAGITIPPKKAFNNLAAEFLSQRQGELQTYLRSLLSRYPLPPKPLAEFIDWHKYEIHGVTTDMAKKLYEYSSTILSGGYPFELTVFQIYTINQRMKSVAPTNITSEPSGDFGNVMDFISAVQNIKVPVCVQRYELSNIVVKTLEFDLSPFQSLQRLEMDSIDLLKMRGYSQLKKTVSTLVIHHSLDNLRHFMLGDLYSIGKGEWVFGDDPVSTTGWDKVTSADFSRNFLHGLDPSIALMRNLEKLNLSDNSLTEVSHLDVLPRLTILKLSNNKLGLLDEFANPSKFDESSTNQAAGINQISNQFEESGTMRSSIVAANPTTCLHTRLGNIEELRLDGNKLKTALIVDRLYSLQILDLSNNEIASYVDILCLGRLKCLEYLYLHNNPICDDAYYRRDVFHTLSDNFTQVHLDGKLPSKRETEMVQLLMALQRGQTNNLDSLRHVSALPTTNASHLTCTISLPLNSSRSNTVTRDRASSSCQYLSLHNPKLQNFVLFSFYWTTGKHHTVDHLFWVLSTTLQNDDISEPKPMVLAVSAQDGTLLPFRILRVKRHQKSSMMPLSTCSPLCPYDDDVNETFLHLNFSPCTPITTQETGVQVVVDSDNHYLRLDQHLSDDQDVNLVKIRNDVFCLKEEAEELNVDDNCQSAHLTNQSNEESNSSSSRERKNEGSNYVIQGSDVNAVADGAKIPAIGHNQPSWRQQTPSSLLESLTRFVNIKNGIHLSVNYMSATTRQFELLSFVNQWRVQDQNLMSLEHLPLCVRGLLRFDSGYTALYTIILTPDCLYLVDERLHNIPKPPVPAKADWGSYASPPSRPITERSVSTQFQPLIPNFGRMGCFLLSNFCSRSSDKVGSKKIGFLPLDSTVNNSYPKFSLPFPEFSYRVLIKIQEQRTTALSDPGSDSGSFFRRPSGASQSSAHLPSMRRRESSYPSINTVTSLDIGFDEVRHWRQFCEQLSALMSSTDSDFSEELSESVVTLTASSVDNSLSLNSGVTTTTTSATSESSNKKEKDSKKGSSKVRETMEMMSFRNYDKSRSTARIRLISHPKLRRLASKSPRDLIRWFRHCLLDSNSSQPSTQSEDLLPTKRIIQKHPVTQSEESILEVLWSSCLVLSCPTKTINHSRMEFCADQRSSMSRVCLLIGGRNSLYIVREELKEAAESAPEADRQNDPIRRLSALEIVHFAGNKLLIGVGLYHQWLWISTRDRAHDSPNCDVILVTGSSEMTSCVMDYLRRVATVHTQSLKIQHLTEDMENLPDQGPQSGSQEMGDTPAIGIETGGTDDQSEEKDSVESDFETASSYSGDVTEGNVERLASGLIEIYHDLPVHSNIDVLMQMMCEINEESPCLHHLSLIEEARLNFTELGCGGEDSTTGDGPDMSHHVPVQGVSSAVGDESSARMLVVVLTNLHICVVQCCATRNWTTEPLRQKPFRLLTYQYLHDLEALTVTSYDTRTMLLRFACLPQQFSPDHFQNYYSAESDGLEVPLEPQLLEIVATSEETRILLVRQLEQACALARQERPQQRGHWKKDRRLKIDLE